MQVHSDAVLGSGLGLWASSPDPSPQLVSAGVGIPPGLCPSWPPAVRAFSFAPEELGKISKSAVQGLVGLC